MKTVGYVTQPTTSTPRFTDDPFAQSQFLSDLIVVFSGSSVGLILFCLSVSQLATVCFLAIYRLILVVLTEIRSEKFASKPVNSARELF